MTINDDCQRLPNTKTRADACAELDELAATPIEELLVEPLADLGVKDIKAQFADIEKAPVDQRPEVYRIAENWIGKLPEVEAANAKRLHTHNRRPYREAGAKIDEHRAGPGREEYNRKRREAYEPAGETKREYVRGLSPEERTERRREQKRLSEARRRERMTQADRDAEAARKKRKRDEATRRTAE